MRSWVSIGALTLRSMAPHEVALWRRSASGQALTASSRDCLSFPQAQALTSSRRPKCEQ
jgi:hypothetical protein